MKSDAMCRDWETREAAYWVGQENTDNETVGVNLLLRSHYASSFNSAERGQERRLRKQVMVMNNRQRE